MRSLSHHFVSAMCFSYVPSVVGKKPFNLLTFANVYVEHFV